MSNDSSASDSKELDLLRQALAFSPDNVPLRLSLAQKLSDKDRPQEALTELQAILKIDKDYLPARKLTALVYLQLWKPAVARVISEELIKLDDPECKLIHAKVLFQIGQNEEASKFYQQALDENPNLRDNELAQKLDPERQELELVPQERFFADQPDIESEQPVFNFSKVGGMDAMKEAIRMKIIFPLKNAQLFAAYGKKAGGGVLLYGPPGCGKTVLARATAGEINADFIPVGLHDILNMYVGQSERQLHQLFETARQQAPCVLFFDEVDALAAKRSDMQFSGGRHVINQFLSELDGVNTNNDGVLILAATNAPWAMDSAFRRPGRFDRIMFVPPPDKKAREAIWKIHLDGKPTQDIDYSALAAETKSFSGADILGIVNDTVEQVLEIAMRKGQMIPITNSDLLKKIRSSKSSTAEWFNTAANYVTYANEAGVYDDIQKFLQSGEN